MKSLRKTANFQSNQVLHLSVGEKMSIVSVYYFSSTFEVARAITFLISILGAIHMAMYMEQTYLYHLDEMLNGNALPPHMQAGVLQPSSCFVVW